MKNPSKKKGLNGRRTKGKVHVVNTPMSPETQTSAANFGSQVLLKIGEPGFGKAEIKDAETATHRGRSPPATPAVD